MFGANKKLKELDLKLEEIKKEKEELLKIKEVLEDINLKIDISDVYVLEMKGIYYLVYKQEKEIVGINYLKGSCNGYESTLIDIFSKKVILKRDSIKKIHRNDVMCDDINDFGGRYSIELIPICELEPSLLVYPNKQVPEYILIQLYYKLNNDYDHHHR